MLVSRGAQRNKKSQLERKVVGSAVVQKYLQVRVGVGLSLVNNCKSCKEYFLIEFAA